MTGKSTVWCVTGVGEKPVRLPGSASICSRDRGRLMGIPPIAPCGAASGSPPEQGPTRISGL